MTFKKLGLSFAVVSLAGFVGFAGNYGCSSDDSPSTGTGGTHTGGAGGSHTGGAAGGSTGGASTGGAAGGSTGGAAGGSTGGAAGGAGGGVTGGAGGSKGGNGGGATGGSSGGAAGGASGGSAGGNSGGAGGNTGGNAGGAGGNSSAALEAGCYSSGTTPKYPTDTTGSMSADDFCALYMGECNAVVNRYADLAACKTAYTAATKKNCRSYHVCNATAYHQPASTHCPHAAGDAPCAD